MARMFSRYSSSSFVYLSKLNGKLDSHSFFSFSAANYILHRKVNRLYCSDRHSQTEPVDSLKPKIAETEHSDDFFGFHSGRGVIDIPVDENPARDPIKRFESLFHKENAERLYETNYGKIRFDFQNSPEYHGQFDGRILSDSDPEIFVPAKSNLNFKINPHNKKSNKSIKQPTLSEVEEAESSYLDELYFGNRHDKEDDSISTISHNNTCEDEKKSFKSDELIHSDCEMISQTSIDSINKANKTDIPYTVSNIKPSYLDEVFFEDIFQKDETPSNEKKYDKIIADNFIEKQFFPEIEQNNSRYSVKKQDVELTKSLPSEIMKKENAKSKSKDKSKADFTLTNITTDLAFKIETEIKDTNISSRIAISNENEGTKHLAPNVKDPKTAFEYIAKIRKEKNLENAEANKTKQNNQEDDLYRKGRVKPLVIDLEKQPEYFVTKLLKDSILYNKDGIASIDKPYGLPCQYSNKRRHFLQKFLPNLAQIVDKENSSPELYTVHRLDMNTTGVLILAKNQEMAHHLNVLFQERAIQKTYLAIVKGIPEPEEGIINIPIAESRVDGRIRMMLKPEFDSETDTKLSKGTFRTYKAVTQYKVISAANGASLLEIKPQTGFTHQIRVHLGFGLNCPVLGDHKYSHLSRLAPQKLTPSMLQKLKVRQSKVRDLPLHLHSYALVIPEIADGQNVHIQAKLPKHFVWALKKLELNKK